MTERLSVIDADGHICEPEAVWTDYTRAEFRDRVLQVRTEGEESYLVIDGEERRQSRLDEVDEAGERGLPALVLALVLPRGLAGRAAERHDPPDPARRNEDVAVAGRRHHGADGHVIAEEDEAELLTV